VTGNVRIGSEAFAQWVEGAKRAEKNIE